MLVFQNSVVIVGLIVFRTSLVRRVRFVIGCALNESNLKLLAAKEHESQHATIIFPLN